MRVICKQVTSHEFDLKEVTTVHSNDFDYRFGGHGLEIDQEYLVMGILTYADSNCLYYLIDTHGKPDWFPHLLFYVSDNTIPQNWFIRVDGKNGDCGIYSLCGFFELCNDIDFYTQLLERNEEAMLTYYKRKVDLENSVAE